MYGGYKRGRRKSQPCFSRGGHIANIRATVHRERGLNAGVTGHCTESTKSIHGTVLYRQCNLPETRRTTFFLFLFSSFLLPSPPLFILHEGISRRREIDRILCTLPPIKISFAWHTPWYRCLFITYFSSRCTLCFFLSTIMQMFVLMVYHNFDEYVFFINNISSTSLTSTSAVIEKFN